MLTFSGRASYLRHEQTPRLFSYYSMIVLSHLMNFPRARVYQVRVERQSWLSARTLLVTTSNILKVSFQSFVQFFFLFFTVYIYPKKHTFAIIIKDTFAGAICPTNVDELTCREKWLCHIMGSRLPYSVRWASPHTQCVCHRQGCPC